MNTKKLIKLVKVLVEVEVSKKQEQFLTKTFPKILEEEVNKRMKTVTPSKVEEVDPFSLKHFVLEEDRKQVEPKKQFSKNPVLNKVTHQLKGFDHMDKTVSFGTQNVAMEGGVPPNLTVNDVSNGIWRYRKYTTETRIRCNNWFTRFR